MLLPEEKQVLCEILNWKDADDAVSYLIEEYAKKSTDNTLYLLNRIQSIAAVLIKQMTERVSEYSQAAYWLIAQREMEPDKSGMFFLRCCQYARLCFRTEMQTVAARRRSGTSISSCGCSRTRNSSLGRRIRHGLT